MRTDQSIPGGGDEGGVVVESSTVSESRLAPPFAVVAVTRTVLAPAFRVAVTLVVCHVSQLPVPGKDRPARTTVPLTEMSAGLSVPVPLAYLKVSVAGPAAVTLNST